MLIVMGPVLGVSVASSIPPRSVRASCLPVSIWLSARTAFFNPSLGPPVPKEERTHSVQTIIWEVVVGVVPLALLITATLGSIIIGLATPTEAAAVGALGSFILALAYRKVTYAGMRHAVLATTATSSMVLLLAVTSKFSARCSSRLGTANWLTREYAGPPGVAAADVGHV